MILPEMFGILGFQKRALMMVEPPGQQRRCGILEIDNRIFIAVKYSTLEGMRSLVRHPPVQKFGFRMNALAVKARENSRGRSAVKAFVVKADPNPQLYLQPFTSGRIALRGKSIKMDIP
jgi:hypothetical protein